MKNLLWSLRQKWQDGTGQETVFTLTADRMSPKLGKQDTGKLTPEPCREKVDKSFHLPASQKSPSDILGKKAKDGCSDVGEDSWVTAAMPVSPSVSHTAASCPSLESLVPRTRLPIV